MWYNNFILKRPGVTILLSLLVVLFFAYHVPSFRLDASADSLVLENDTSLKYYRTVRSNYGSDDYLILTYTPNKALFDEESLADLRALSSQLVTLKQIQSVTSLLNVPLLNSPPVSLSDLQKKIPTLDDPETDKVLARQEFISSPIYRNLLISPDGNTTALQLTFKQTEIPISQIQLSKEITEIRAIMSHYSEKARLHLGGVPMITSDSIDYIQHDLLAFGIGVIIFLILILSIAFNKPRWVILPLLTCFSTGVIMVGFLGLVDWPVTVVSSNFISLLLIITLSLTVHLIVRYREEQTLFPDANQEYLVKETIRAKALPCFYTAITTIVAFCSLLFSGIRPVIDFGWMMAIGIVVAFVLVFTFFPAALMLLKPGKVANHNDITDKITRSIARLNQSYHVQILLAFVLLSIFALAGMNFLSVENRFIDYFKKDTEIYQGMELIDRKLGGTTPLDVIIDTPLEFFTDNAKQKSKDAEDDDWGEESSTGIAENSYWFNTFKLGEVAAIQNYLDSLPETGKVLSISSSLEVLSQLDKEIMVDDFSLSIFYKKLSDEIKEVLFDPYMSEDGNQLRFSIRVFESNPSLKREALLETIKSDLVTKFNLKEEQIHLTGMLVLYNNMLQSLFTSQIMTLGVVFLAILSMFIFLFRNVKRAVVAIVPNVFAAGLMLGLMGWLRIPLDLMTITIAAITIGIAVDDTIHYIHRFSKEFEKDKNYWAAIERSHATIGRAMYYTSLTITLGFSILVLSNFIPTIYFGLLTSFAMLIALIANLTLLPLLLVKFKS
ncbi:MAG: putative RND superfamily exporter protein [Enterobacterales bacterium]|jgi:predicted RND superfamily exporter protein